MAPPKGGVKQQGPPIASQGDEARYTAKYQALKEKTATLEDDNLKVLVKILQAKKNIQRLRLERSVLYERLGAERGLNAAAPASAQIAAPQPPREELPSVLQPTREHPPTMQMEQQPMPMEQQTMQQSVQQPPAEFLEQQQRYEQQMQAHAFVQQGQMQGMPGQ